MIYQSEDIKEIIRLYQFKGKDFYFKEILKKDLNSISREAIEKECFILAKYLKLNVTEARQRAIIKKDSSPKTSDEKILSNIKKIFKTFNERIKGFDIISNQFLRLGEQLFFGVKKIKFDSYVTTRKVNLLEEKEKVYKRKNLEELIEKYTSMLNEGNYEIVLLLSAFYIDFINSKIFNEENEIIGLFMIYALLFREGFEVFRYESFFEIYVDKAEEFKQAFLESSYHWEEGFPNPRPLANCIISILNEVYQKIDAKVRSIEIIGDNSKTNLIESTIYKHMPNVFTKEMIANRHPNVSPKTIDRTLQRMRDANIIRANGQGRNATWVKLVETEQFDINAKQMTLFDDLDFDDIV